MQPNRLVRDTYELTSEAANVIVDACQKTAEKEGVVVNIAVVDPGGHLKAFRRMDGAPLLSIEIAQNKAYTAVAFGKPTAEWYPLIEREPALLHGIVHTPRLVIFAGGLPIRVKDHIVGGVGVSGGTAEQDEVIAQAGVSALDHLWQRMSHPS